MQSESIVFKNVSKFYGEVLGINRVSLAIEPGITGLVGPNGSGKSTMMNLMTGLLRPTRGSISVVGMGPYESEKLFREVGYCTQFDSFPRGFTGYQFLNSYLKIHGFKPKEADSRRPGHWKDLHIWRAFSKFRRR